MVIGKVTGTTTHRKGGLSEGGGGDVDKSKKRDGTPGDIDAKKSVDTARETQKLKEPAVVNEGGFEAKDPTTKDAKALSQNMQKAPSSALNKSARILDPRLMGSEFDALLDKPAPKVKPEGDGGLLEQVLDATERIGGGKSDLSEFEALLDKPFTPTGTASDAPAFEPLVAKLPPDRKLPIGTVTFAHEEGKLVVTGTEDGAKKPEVVAKKMAFADGARYGLAIDAALVAQMPSRFGTSTREPPEMWVALAAAQRAANTAMKVDQGRTSAFDAARVLRGMLPKAKPIFGAKTTMEQIEAFAGLAKAVVDGPGTPMENAVGLEEKSLQAKGSSLLMEVIKESDKKAGKTSLLDEILEQPGGGVAKTKLPDDDNAVVATLDGKDITAGDIREMALREQKAVDFIVPGFADANGSEHDLKIHVEKKGKGFEWSFYGTEKRSGRMKILSGEFSPAGLEKLKETIESQPRYDMIPYKAKGERFSPKLAEAALAALEKDRAQLEAEIDKRRGDGVSVDEIFPHLNPTGLAH